MQGLKNHINVLENEMEVLASRLEPTDTGHLHSTKETYFCWKVKKIKTNK